MFNTSMLQTSRKRSILIKINKLYSEIPSLIILPERKNNLKIIYATSLKKGKVVVVVVVSTK